jgi:peptidoglycan-N-acetylglucosamine deacetylase
VAGSGFPILLTFDLDAESAILARDPADADRPVTLSRGQYGPKRGLPRLLALLRREQIPATFFVPGWVVDHYPAAIDAILQEGHELAHHGYHHIPPASQSPADEEAALVAGSEAIRKASGHAPVGYRSPSWEFSAVTLQLLERYGFRYSSNCMDDDRPYIHERDGRATGLVELPVQWLLDDFPYFGVNPQRGMLGQTPPDVAFAAWSTELEGLAREEGACFVLTMHPQLIGRASRVLLLERLIGFARALGPMEFLRCRDLAERVRQSGSLAAGPVRQG